MLRKCYIRWKTYTLKVSIDTSANGKKFTLWTDNQNITDTSVQYKHSNERKQNGVPELWFWGITTMNGAKVCLQQEWYLWPFDSCLMCRLIIVGPKKMCEFIFDKRFYIAVGIFLILVCKSEFFIYRNV